MRSYYCKVLLQDHGGYHIYIYVLILHLHSDCHSKYKPQKRSKRVIWQTAAPTPRVSYMDFVPKTNQEYVYIYIHNLISSISKLRQPHKKLLKILTLKFVFRSIDSTEMKNGEIKKKPLFLSIYIYIYLEPKRPLFWRSTPQTRLFPIKIRVIWVDIYIYIYIYTHKNGHLIIRLASNWDFHCPYRMLRETCNSSKYVWSTRRCHTWMSQEFSKWLVNGL